MQGEVNGILVAAHDLERPLGLTRQLALSMDFAQDSPAELAQTRDRIVAVSERALSQVEDLTKLARLEDGLFELEPVSVRGVCDEVAQELNSLYAFNHKQLATRYAARLPLAAADRTMLKSVVYNFCLNAAQYSGEQSLAQLSVSLHQRQIRVAVRDYGPALPTDVQRALNQGWIDKPLSISMRPGSSGLGLYIAARFARAMRAQVGAVRHRDGSTFYVDLAPSQQRSLFA